MRPPARICYLSHLGLTDIITQRSWFLTLVHGLLVCLAEKVTVNGHATGNFQVCSNTCEKGRLSVQLVLGTCRDAFKCIRNGENVKVEST